ncbi:SurA N-terminal domain-containing protein [Glaciecola sp. KUL10]|uniref:SurA N-terminal domain-containing protein n=1 Tax=Glaciecola sp. (strain KUL10) TaxID=2161813 RepID=UPI000D78B698|nr:SurA N-terminal domain-containing protein [Glaciecola sp. KUL10]GBL04720.1 PpiC-type peptidyl-prolyl cis-trans isomerase [Glaciecola sp. KUL10]
MLEKIREGAQGPWAVAIVGLIVLSFVFTGVGSYLGGSTSGAVATVNGEEITAQSLETAYQNERSRMEAQFGEAVSAMFANPETLTEFRSNILQRLINERLVQQKAYELGLRVGDEEIKQTIVEMPEFQLLGQFDNDTYLARLRQAGFQATDFRDLMRNQMTAQQLNQAISGSSFSLKNEVSRLLTLQQQTRDASVLEISVDSFKPQVELTEEEIQAYYDANIMRFETQEQVKLAYVNLEVSELMKNESVTEDEARAFYEENKARYQTEEERRVSHILIEFNDDEELALAQAQSIRDEVMAEGADFTAIAAEKSADIVSAESGGDLDFITIGMMEPSFEEAAFALPEVGAISEVVRTEFGFHIIKLTDLTPSVVTAFEEVSQDITDTLLKEKALDKFFEYQEQMAALAFEVPDSLDEVANVFEGTVFETAFFERGRLPAAVSYPQIEGIAFTSELVDEGVNSDLIEINNEKVMVIRVADHKPQRTLQLDEVRAGIEAQLTQDKAQELAIAFAQELESDLHAGNDIQGKLDEQGIQWLATSAVSRNASSLDPEVTKALFALSTEKENNSDVVTQANANVALVKLDGVNQPAEITEEDIKASQTSFAASNSRRVFESFVEALKAEAEIVITQ